MGKSASVDRRTTIAESVRTAMTLLERYLAGFDETNRTAQAPGLPNHAVWTLGHLALYNHRAAERLDGAELPASEFVAGDGHAGDARRFDTESVAFGSSPTDDPASYPPLDRAISILRESCERLARAVEQADDPLLDSEMPWGNAPIPLWQTAMRMVFHMGTHTGQLVDLRRALGVPGIFG